jgi:3-phenylpropionate/trans-cinnamate dioxygenase ferredoxin component
MSGTSVELGDLSGLRDGHMRVFPDIGTNGIIVCRVAGRLHALEDNCSHRDARLSEGRLRGTLITCPLHGAQFNVCDGQQQGPPAVLPVASFPVTEDGETAVVHVAPD